jgi:hypothetical protein
MIIGEPDILARSMLEVVATDRESVAIAAKEKDMQIRPGEAYARRRRVRE